MFWSGFDFKFVIFNFFFLHIKHKWLAWPSTSVHTLMHLSPKVWNITRKSVNFCELAASLRCPLVVKVGSVTRTTGFYQS